MLRVTRVTWLAGQRGLQDNGRWALLGCTGLHQAVIEYSGLYKAELDFVLYLADFPAVFF